VLCLEAEHEHGHEGLGIDEARPPLAVRAGRHLVVQVAVRVDDAVVDEGEEEPAEQEAQGAGEQRPAPLHLNQRRPKVAKAHACFVDFCTTTGWYTY